MAGNTNPIYTKIGAITGVAIGGSANTKSDGQGTIGTDIFLVFTADATNGSFVQRIRFSPYATTAATPTSPTTIRVFVSSATSGATTSANAWLFAEASAAAQTADHSTTAIQFLEIPLNFALPASYTILATCHVVNAASTGWNATVFGGTY